MTLFDLTTPQQNIWNLQKFYEGTSISNISGMIRFRGVYDKEKLNQAINEFIKNSDSFNLRFCEENGKAKQFIAQYEYQEISELDLSNYEESEIDETLEFEGLKSFEIMRKPLYRFIILNFGNGSGGVFLCANHLISDAWTFSFATKETIRYYNFYLNKREVLVSINSYKDFIDKERNYFLSENFLKDNDYWASKFYNKPVISQIRPGSVESKTPKSDRRYFILQKDMCERISKLCVENCISPAILFEAAVFLYLYKINDDNEKTTIGIPVLNRKNFKEKATPGMFVSIIPLIVEIDNSDTVLALFKKISSTHMDVFRHQKYPYSGILQNVRKRFGEINNLFDVMVSYQNSKLEDTKFDGGFKTKWYCNKNSDVSLAIHIDERDVCGEFNLIFDYQIEVFKNSQEVEFLYNRIIYLIQQMTNNLDMTVAKISIVPPAEMQKEMHDFNDTKVVYPKEKCVHHLFEEQVEITPNKTAVVSYDKTYTYKDLNITANKIANALISYNIKLDDVVAIFMPRRSYLIATMLGILKSGGAYMPIDPDYPSDRIKYMIQNSQAKAIVTTKDFAKNIDCTCDVLFIEDLIKKENAAQPEIMISKESLCYCIYTSGSTGKPKGTLITHGSLANYCHINNYNVVDKIIPNNTFTIAAITTVGFDIFVTESLLPMANGMTVVLANEEQSNNQRELNKLVLEKNIDVLQTTPSKMQILMLDDNYNEYLSRIKVLILGGEELDKTLVKRIRRISSARIFNIYGPTETTVWSTNTEITSDEITIGKPMANTQIYILNKNLSLLPIGVVGELCIAGDSVGRGYLNRPDIDAEKFVDNPFGEGKMYKTGDLARWRVDGNIEFIGRNDFQVKIRGLRIELGEIEGVLLAFATVKQTVVEVQLDENQRQYICAFYVADSNLDITSVRSYMEEQLPHYMLPHAFIRLEKMPCTSSGKIDRKALPKNSFKQITTTQYLDSVTVLQKEIIRLMKDVLKLSQIGVLDNFFQIGGDSLKAIEFAAKAHNAGIYLNIQAVYDNPIVEQLCNFIQNNHKNLNLCNEDELELYELNL